MHILAQLPSDFWVTVVIIFGGVFIFVLISLADAQAKGGWSSFAKRYPARTRPAGDAHSVPSWTYCDVHWNTRGLRVIFTENGIYFYMMFYRRLAHPPFLVPWESVKPIKKERGLLGEYSVLEIEDAAGRIQLDLCSELEHVLARYQKVT
jgi:hypothetical protein